MSNPTREDIQGVLDTVTNHYGNHGTCCECADLRGMCLFALRGLNMRDTMEQAADTWSDQVLRGVIQKAVKRFDGGDDDKLL